jgi:hypothetical protein
MGLHDILGAPVCLLVARYTSVCWHLADGSGQVGLAVPEDQLARDGFEQAEVVAAGCGARPA